MVTATPGLVPAGVTQSQKWLATCSDSQDNNWRLISDVVMNLFQDEGILLLKILFSWKITNHTVQEHLPGLSLTGFSTQIVSKEGTTLRLEVNLNLSSFPSNVLIIQLFQQNWWKVLKGNKSCTVSWIAKLLYIFNLIKLKFK